MNKNLYYQFFLVKLIVMVKLIFKVFITNFSLSDCFFIIVIKFNKIKTHFNINFIKVYHYFYYYQLNEFGFIIKYYYYC